METPNRDYNSITPSARSLLLMKGMTDIPFAKEAATLMLHPGTYEPDFNNKDFYFWARLLHFESRYWSIDQLLSLLPAKNILEISSGFSFRGLKMIQEKKVHYIDTDLPDFIEIKKKFIDTLQSPNNAGQLETLPLNALDEKQFDEVASHFPEGEITIVNEGLLMYLGIEEKEKLCRIIHGLLKQRGGYWVTADIYTRYDEANLALKMEKKQKEFFELHRIEENKFESFESAEQFFKKAGFIIDEEAVPDFSRLTSLKYFKQFSPAEIRKTKHRATWRLKAV